MTCLRSFTPLCGCSVSNLVGRTVTAGVPRPQVLSIDPSPLRRPQPVGLTLSVHVHPLRGVHHQHQSVSRAGPHLAGAALRCPPPPCPTTLVGFCACMPPSPPVPRVAILGSRAGPHSATPPPPPPVDQSWWPPGRVCPPHTSARGRDLGSQAGPRLAPPPPSPLPTLLVASWAWVPPRRLPLKDCGVGSCVGRNSSPPPSPPPIQQRGWPLGPPPLEPPLGAVPGVGRPVLAPPANPPTTTHS